MTGKEVIKILKKYGWKLDRIKGSHHIFIKDDKTIPVPVWKQRHSDWNGKKYFPPCRN